MATEFDHLTLSAYVDGELDRRTMREVERFMDKDARARRFVLDAMHTTVLLRAGGNEAVLEPVPERLRQVFHRSAQSAASRRDRRFPALKLAAACAILVVGVGLGFLLNPGPNPATGLLYNPLPAAYAQAINQSLENHMSGDPFSIDLGAGGRRIVITPIKTYRNPEGEYYRGYDMVLIADGVRQKFRGMAYRTGKAQWRTTALYLPKI